MARRGRLSGLHSELRRRQRRRYRRHRRCAGATAVPGRALGVDALWFNPWYPSPLADAGYDISDYRSIDPAFGTLWEAERLITEAREVGIRTIVDIVPNHVSSEHPWFREALASPPGSPARGLFWFRPGLGENGELPAERLAVDLRRAGMDPHRRRRVVPAPVRARAA